jgi:tRNA modification GTPase
MREGVSCAIVGKPNVGKSSLFNTLLDRDRALVSNLAGTTRDMLEEAIQIGGLYIRLIDTAGLGFESKNPLDQIGMDRTRETLERVSIVLYAVDGSAPLDKKDEEAWQLVKEHSDVICLVNKKDQPQALDNDQLQKWIGKTKKVFISAHSKEGLSDLEKALEKMVSEKMGTEESQQITRLRHKRALERALEFLRSSETAFLKRESLDLVTLDFKSALDAMSELLGETYSEDLLDVIFSEFCIGK